MRLASVYAVVVLIWSTTPLGIRFSVESLDFIQALALRMWISLALCVLLLKIFGIKFIFTRAAITSYALGALAITGAMLCVYWAANILASGLIAVLWGLTPLIVSLYSMWLLPNSAISLNRFLCLMLALVGLYIIFSQQISLGGHMVIALFVLLLGVNLHSLSSVLMQRLHLNNEDAKVHPLLQTTGALAISAPVYALVWLFFSGPLPAQISIPSMSAIAYLSVFGSVVGFIGYFYLLNNMSAANVALVTLITPILALLLGSYLAHESLQFNTWLGTGIIMLALLVNQVGQLRLIGLAVKKYLQGPLLKKA